MNVLWFHDDTESPRTAGWRRIMCTNVDGQHPYAENWWPDAHGLGYETQRVLEAALISAKQRCAIKLSQVK